MLVREGNKIKFYKKRVFEKGNDAKTDDRKIITLLMKAGDIIGKKLSNELDFVKWKDADEHFIYNNGLDVYEEGLMDWVKRTFTEKGKVESWLNNLVTQIEGLFTKSSFTKQGTKPSNGGFVYTFGTIDEKGNYKKEILTSIDNYIKTVEKIPKNIKVNLPKTPLVNKSYLQAVKNAFKQDVATEDLTFFFYIKEETKEEIHNCLTISLGVIAKPSIMGKNGDYPVIQDKYIYNISSVCINTDAVATAGVEIPNYLEEKAGLHSHTDKKASDDQDTYFKGRTLNPQGSRQDKFYDVLKEIEKKGLEKYKLIELEEELLPYIFDEDIEELFEKLGGDNKARKELNVVMDYVAPKEIMIDLWKSIKDKSFKSIRDLQKKYYNDDGTILRPLKGGSNLGTNFDKKINDVINAKKDAQGKNSKKTPAGNDSKKTLVGDYSKKTIIPK